MLVSIGDVRLFADVSGRMLVPDGPKMRDQPVIVMVHGGSLIGPVVVTYRHRAACPSASPSPEPGMEAAGIGRVPAWR